VIGVLVENRMGKIFWNSKKRSLSGRCGVVFEGRPPFWFRLRTYFLKIRAFMPTEGRSYVLEHVHQMSADTD